MNDDILDYAISRAQDLGLNPELVLSMIEAESNFNPKATSNKGARGLMQVMPATAAEMGYDPETLHDPFTSIDAGTQYLRQMMDKYDDPGLAVAAYNAGPGAVDKHGGIPPFDETINYVSKVFGKAPSAMENFRSGPQPYEMTDTGELFQGPEVGARPAADSEEGGGYLADLGISALQGAIDVPNAAVGIADIFTGGRAGKFLNDLGFRPEDANEILDSWKSTRLQAAEQQFSEAEGLGGAVGTIAENPALISNAVSRMLPAMGAGGAVGQGMGLIRAALSGGVRAGIGEGVVSAGLSASGIRSQTEDNLLTGEQAGIAALSGGLTGLFGVGGAKLARKLGLGDIDEALVTGSREAQAGLTKRIIGGALTEGLFEELPQSVQEQVLQNHALGRPVEEGVLQAAVMGTVVGAAAGGGFGAIAGGKQRTPPNPEPKDELDAVENDIFDLQNSLGDIGSRLRGRQGLDAEGFTDIGATGSAAPTTALGAAPTGAEAGLPSTKDQTTDRETQLADVDSRIARVEQALSGDVRGPARAALQRQRAELQTQRAAVTPEAAMAEIDTDLDTYAKTGATASGQDPLTLWEQRDKVAGQAQLKQGAAQRTAIPATTSVESSFSIDLSGDPNIQRVFQRAGLTVPKAGKRSTATPKQLAQRVKSAIGVPATVITPDQMRTASPGKVSMKQATAIQSIAAAAGHDVVFYESEDQRTGFVVPGDKDRIYINTRQGDQAHMVVFGHELLHQIRQNSESAYKGFVTALAKHSSINDDALLTFFSSYGAVDNDALMPDAVKARLEAGESATDIIDAELASMGKDRDWLMEEGAADIFGDNFSDPKFWRKVTSELGRKDPGALRKLKNFIDAMVEFVKAALKGGKFGTGETFAADLEAIRAVAAETLADYTVRRRKSLGADRDEAANIARAERETADAPSAGQKDAGNYKKGRFSFHGTEIAVETVKGQERTGKTEDGKEWSVKMPATYGYFTGTKSTDGEGLDVFVGNAPKAQSFWVINQNKPDSKDFDEHKFMVGFPLAGVAKKAYLDSFSDDFGKRVFGSMEGPFPMDTLSAKVGEMQAVAASNTRTAQADHKLEVTREERERAERATMSRAELKQVTEDAKAFGFNRKELERRIRVRKMDYPVEAGWAPITFDRIDPATMEAKATENTPLPAEAIFFKKQPYAFHLDAKGKPGKDTREARVKTLSSSLAGEILAKATAAGQGDPVAQTIMRQSSWYRALGAKLRQSFGGFTDFFAQLLGPTSANNPVEPNFRYATEALTEATSGRWDNMFREAAAWRADINAAAAVVDAYESSMTPADRKAIKEIKDRGDQKFGAGVQSKERTAWNKAELKRINPGLVKVRESLRKAAEFKGEVPTRENGKLFGMATDGILKILADTWGDKAPGDSPKTKNYYQNIVGRTWEATIDVWAARTLRRMANDQIGNFPRIPAPAEKGVAGKILATGTDVAGGEFGFGQDVFRQAAAELRASGVEAFKDSTAADVQAMIWFSEKELWARRDWTNKIGEGGSLEEELALAGHMDRKQLNAWRVAARKGQPPQPDTADLTAERKAKVLERWERDVAAWEEARDGANAALEEYEAVPDRFVAGVSPSIPGGVPTNSAMSLLGREIEKVAKAQDGVMAVRASASIGEFMGDTERAIDFELVTRNGYDASALMDQLRAIGDREGQEAVFLSRVLRPDETVDPMTHRPGFELYFGSPVAPDRLAEIMGRINEAGVHGMTLATEGRRTASMLAGEAQPVVGIRVQFIPEFALGGETLSQADILSSINDASARMERLASELGVEADVSSAGNYWYETEVHFNGDTTGATAGVDRPSGEAAQWSGLGVLEGLERAARFHGEGSRKAGLEAAREVLRGRASYQGPDGGSSERVRGSSKRTRYGEQGRENAVTVEGLHYSREKRGSLDTGAYGTGLKGAEAARLGLPGADPRLSKRAHFYVNEGQGVAPESGTGFHAHAVTLDNLYDWVADPLKLWPAAKAAYATKDEQTNAVEKAILDAGFDGVYARGAQGKQGVAVVLGPHAVPVDYLGMGRQDVAPAAPVKLTREQQLKRDLVADRSLPAGKMSGPKWGAELKKGHAELHAMLEPTGVFKRMELMYRDELLKSVPYQNAPDSLMGFGKPENQKGYYDSNYPKAFSVRVTFPDGDTFVDQIRGMNAPHATERARRNWPSAEVENLGLVTNDTGNPDIRANTTRIPTKRGEAIAHGNGISLDPIRQIRFDESDFDEDGLTLRGLMGHGGWVEPGNRVFHYAIYDNTRKRGDTVLEIDPDGNMVALHDIKIYTPTRGTGSRVIQSLVDNTNRPSLKIIDILPQSREFWRKQNATQPDADGNAEIVRQGSVETALRGTGTPDVARASRALDLRVEEDLNLTDEELKALGFKFSTKRAADWFDTSKKEAVGFKSREKLVEMPIDDFLALALKGTSEEKAGGVRAVVESGSKFSDLPFLLFRSDGAEATVTGHEGRHRARALQGMGYNTMPVLLVGDIRWSEQSDPNRFDYREVWPSQMVGEEGETLPFPVAREAATQPYDPETSARPGLKFSNRRNPPPAGTPLPGLVEKAENDPAFRNWFGNSKVVENLFEAYGKKDGYSPPLILFHGTTQDIREFKPSEDGLLGPGIYLTPRSDYAGSYATGEGANVLPLFASIQNPLRLTSNYEAEEEGPVFQIAMALEDQLGGERAARRWARQQMEDWAGIGDPDFIEMMREEGYDGVMLGKLSMEGSDVRYDVEEVSAFYPEQVKSALSVGRGGFRTMNPDILSSSERTSLGDPKPSEAERVERAVRGKTMHEAASYLATKGSAPTKVLASKISDQIRALEAEGVSFDLKIAHLGDSVPLALTRARGVTVQDAGKVAVWLNGADVTGKVGVSEETLLHELVHGVTLGAIRVGNMRSNAGTQLAKDVADLYSVANAVTRHFNRRITEKANLSDFEKAMYSRANNALLGPDEVVAWGLTNREAQEYLATIPYKGTSVWTAFVRAVKKMLGLELEDTALGEVLRVGESLVSADAALASTFGRERAVQEVRASSLRLRPEILDHLSPAQVASLRNVGGIQEPVSWLDKVKQLKENAGARVVKGLFDQFAPLKKLDYKAYILARMSRGSDGALEATLLYGKPVVKGDTLDVDVTDEGFLKVLQQLNGEQDLFLQWVAANRAKDLKGEGKEFLYSDADIRNLTRLNEGQMKDGRDRATVYGRALKDYNAFQKAILDVAQARGIIDADSRDVWESQFYVPFYRNMEDGTSGPSIKSGLVRQYAYKKLKGSRKKLQEDLLANVLQNWAHLLSASAKNHAATATLRAANRQGFAHQVPPNSKGAVFYLENGLQKWFMVDDPLLLDAVGALESINLHGYEKVMGKFKQYLTFGVTVNPTFKVRNLIRDSVSAIAVAPLSGNIAGNLKAGWKATAKDSQTYASMLANGGLIRFGTLLDGNRADHARRLIESGVDDQTVLDTQQKFTAFLKNSFEKYQDVGDRMENINRAALYENVMSKTGDPLLASFAARDLMDFSSAGAWPAIRLLSQVVPFMNARLQGLYKLGRGAAEDPKRFGTVVGATMLASILLFLTFKDDDEWKQREDWDRDAYWWFKIGGVAFRIPKPFEVGALGTLAERSLELMVSDEMTGERFASRIGHMVADTFAMNPTPQIFKPLADVWANKDSFTGRAIESMSMEKLRPEDRVHSRTSELARFLSNAGLPNPFALSKGEFKRLSPVQIDHLVRGYFSWAGTFATQTVDLAVRAVAVERPDAPAPKLRDTFFIGNFVETLPSGSSRYVTGFYEQSKSLTEDYMSWRQAVRLGDTARAQEILEERPGLRRDYKELSAARRGMSEINASIKQIEVSTTMSPADKRAAIDVLQQRRNNLARMTQ